MILYDDKTKSVIKAGNQLLIPSIDSDEDIVFKASFVISAGLKCAGKITALFDLIVLGDVSATEIEVKGRFVCMGHCEVLDALVVQNDIWGEDIQAKSITCHDRIVAQSVDAESVIADRNIIIGKTLAIEESAFTNQNVICGETAYGSGRIIATSILTAEPLDLDDGEQALENPYQYLPEVKSSGDSELSKTSMEYAQGNDYEGFINKLMEIPDEAIQKRLKVYLYTLKSIELSFPEAISDLTDSCLLLCLLEISHSEYFKGWNTITEWTDTVLKHFIDIAEGRAVGKLDPKPATKLEKDYIVIHSKYGKGIVCSTQTITINGKASQIVVVDFESQGIKKFPLPDSMKFFSILSEGGSSPMNEEPSIQCNISSYSEWLSSLQLIDQYKELLGTSLYDIIYGLLLAKLGLKPMFVENRFKEKGWN